MSNKHKIHKYIRTPETLDGVVDDHLGGKGIIKVKKKREIVSNIPEAYSILFKLIWTTHPIILSWEQMEETYMEYTGLLRLVEEITKMKFKNKNLLKESFALPKIIRWVDEKMVSYFIKYLEERTQRNLVVYDEDEEKEFIPNFDNLELTNRIVKLNEYFITNSRLNILDKEGIKIILDNFSELEDKIYDEYFYKAILLRDDSLEDL